MVLRSKQSFLQERRSAIDIRSRDLGASTILATRIQDINPSYLGEPVRPQHVSLCFISSYSMRDAYDTYEADRHMGLSSRMIDRQLGKLFSNV